MVVLSETAIGGTGMNLQSPGEPGFARSDRSIFPRNLFDVFMVNFLKRVRAIVESPGHQVLSITAALTLMLFMSPTVQAGQPPLSIEPAKMQPSLVLGRPMITWWEVKIQSSGLMVGKLTFVIKNDREFLATTETEELTLNGPEQRIRVMLPAIDSLNPIDQLQVDVSFRGKSFSGNLGQQILHVPFFRKKVFIGLATETSTMRKGGPRREQLMDRLRFENVVPRSEAYRSAEIDSEYIKTIYASVDPADFPSEPLAYCGYDIAIVAGSEFRNLRKPQLEALLAWIKAGGSLYLEPDGVLEPYHLEFLQNLVGDDPRAIVMQVDQAGKLLQDFAVNDGPGLSLKCGLGHAAMGISNPNLDSEFSGNAWVKFLRPLWHSRSTPLETPAEQSQYVYNPPQNPAPTVNTNSEHLAKMLASASRLPQTELLERLMPEGVRMVPLSVLSSILFVFVVLIGPGDYFVLGWLRMRKLTWVTFPLTTLCITAFTVSLSNSYMSTAETRRAIIMRDVGPSGLVVRTNRFELLYIAASRLVKTDVEKGFFASLKTGRSMINPTTGMVDRETDEFDTTSVRTAGRIPTEYTASQNVSKWTPQINRVFSIPGTTEKPDVDWSRFSLQTHEADMILKHLIPARLVDQVRSDFGPDALVACFTGEGGWADDTSTGWLSKRTPQNEAINQMNRRNRNYYPGAIDPIPEINNAKLQHKPDFFLWLYRMSVGFPGPGMFTPTAGIYSLVQQTAPTGSANCQDLPLLDSSDPGAWLLVIVVPGKEETIVYRKPMRFE